MKVNIFRLISSDPAGVDNHNGLLDLLYSYFLWQNGLDHYYGIRVHQIGKDQGVEEFVEIKGNYVHVNIYCEIEGDFHSMDDVDKNKARLAIIHAGLLRLSKEDRRFFETILEQIRDEILSNNFEFNLEGMEHICKQDDKILCKFVISPKARYFDHFLVVQKAGDTICKQFIYRGKPNTDYLESFFSSVKWQDQNKVVITGKDKQMKMTLSIDNCELVFENLTQYAKPPLWEMMKAEISPEERASAYDDWVHSLPPQYGLLLDESQN